MPCKYYGNCKYQDESCKQNTALIKCVYGLNNELSEHAWEIDNLREGNKELKMMLKQAVDDIGKHSFCNICENNNDETKCKKCKAITLDMFKWKHADEVLEVLKDD